MRLAWWRATSPANGRTRAAGSPVALALSAAIDAYALPRAFFEAMLDARLQEIAPQDDFNLAAFRAFADESEGARLRLASLIAAGGLELDQADAHAPAGMALALTRLIGQLPFKAGSAPTLIPADVAARHGASAADFDARRASPASLRPAPNYGELRATNSPRPSGGLKAQARRSCRRSSRLGPCGSTSIGSTATPPGRSIRGRSLAAPAPMGDLALGAGV